MLALFFEVKPFPDQMQNYLDRAAALKPELDRVGGCLFIERFRSLSRPGTLLSFQLWRDEAAMTAWRVNAQHHAAQMLGREQVFEDYRLRVAAVITATVQGEPVWHAPHPSGYHDRTHRPPRYLHCLQATSAEPQPAMEAFSSLYREGQYLHVGELEHPDAATALAARVGATRVAHRVVEIERDYGMFDRAEAPQFCPVIRRP